MNVSCWKRGVAAAMAALLGVAFATPCLASEAGPLTLPSADRPLLSATQAKLASLDTSKAVRFTQAPGGAADESKPFFRSTKGAVVAVLLVGGFTWAVVSRSRDAVHSPAR